MPNFTFQKVVSIKPHEDVYQLFIDGEGQLDLFEQETKSQQSRHFARILYILEQVASGTRFRDDKFHLIKTPSSIQVRAYECKVSSLRLYVAQALDGKVVVLGGMKNRQKSDIRRFTSLLEQLADQLQTHFP